MCIYIYAFYELERCFIAESFIVASIDHFNCTNYFKL